MKNEMFSIKNISALDRIFKYAVKSVNPYHLVKEKTKIENNVLSILSEEESQEYDLSKYEKIFITGAGKAGYLMALGIEEILGKRITSGIISVKKGFKENISNYSNLKRIRILESGHPVPDNNSIETALYIEKLSEKADNKTLFVNLISGGGSALLCYPYRSGNTAVSLEDIRITNNILLKCGAEIAEVNCIRKHISAIKGGRLLKMLHPSECITLILSDVTDNRLDTIASGLTAPDNSTFQDAESIIEKYSLKGKLPLSVLDIIKSGYMGKIEETVKKNDEVLNNCRNFIIGSNYTAVNAACKKAVELGFNTVVYETELKGEARDAGKKIAQSAKSLLLKNITKPLCAIYGGETTVTVKGYGKGGRNQELALSFLKEIKNINNNKSLYLLSASTDGNDGPTDAAGAFACSEALKAAEAKNLSLEKYLQNNDSYTFFKKTGFLYKTGLTNTNVCDLQLLLSC
jgi:glycerate 2-kinase